MSVPIMRQYESLSKEQKDKVERAISQCNLKELISVLEEILGREVREKEAKYLMIELNPECLKPASTTKAELDEEKYYRQVDVGKELDFLFNFEKERLLVARKFEAENNIPLTMVDKIVEVLLKILELKIKSTASESGFDRLMKTLRMAVEQEE